MEHHHFWELGTHLGLWITHPSIISGLGSFTCTTLAHGIDATTDGTTGLLECLFQKTLLLFSDSMTQPAVARNQDSTGSCQESRLNWQSQESRVLYTEVSELSTTQQCQLLPFSDSENPRRDSNPSPPCRKRECYHYTADAASHDNTPRKILKCSYSPMPPVPQYVQRISISTFFLPARSSRQATLSQGCPK